MEDAEVLLVKGSNTVICLLSVLIMPHYRRGTALYFVMSWVSLIRISHSPWLAFPWQHTIYWLYFLLESIVSHARLKQQLLVAVLKVIA